MLKISIAFLWSNTVVLRRHYFFFVLASGIIKRKWEACNLFWANSDPSVLAFPFSETRRRYSRAGIWWNLLSTLRGKRHCTVLADRHSLAGCVVICMFHSRVLFHYHDVLVILSSGRMYRHVVLPWTFHNSYTTVCIAACMFIHTGGPKFWLVGKSSSHLNDLIFT